MIVEEADRGKSQYHAAAKPVKGINTRRPPEKKRTCSDRFASRPEAHMQHDETADDEEQVDTGCTGCRQPIGTEPACRTVGLL
jgi:hypothetical protein